MENSTFLILMTVALVALLDYVPRAFVLAKKPIKAKTSYGRVPKYLIMPTTYNNISYLKNLSFLKKYADKVVICTSKYETEEFYRELRKVCRQYGFRYIRADVPFAGGKPIRNAYTIYRGAFSSLKNLGVRKDTPCLLIDADTYSHDNVNNLIRTFIDRGADISSLRCEVANPKTIIEKLQAFEYRLAMDNRRMDPWLTSGACNLAKAGVFRRVFSRHSHFFAGGDIEIGKLAQVMGYKVRHIDFTFYTAAPDTIRDWFNQRVIWFAGGFRHHVTNMASFGWHHFFMLIYNSLILYLLFPLRWFELLNFPLTLVALVLFSWVYTVILAAGKGWKPIYLLLPVYSFAQSMIILPIAFGRYVKLAWHQRSLGILRYELSRFRWSTRLLFRLLNVSTAGFIVYAAILFTTARVEYWTQHGSFFTNALKLAFR